MKKSYLHLLERENILVNKQDGHLTCAVVDGRELMAVEISHSLLIVMVSEVVSLLNH